MKCHKGKKNICVNCNEEKQPVISHKASPESEKREERKKERERERELDKEGEGARENMKRESKTIAVDMES